MKKVILYFATCILIVSSVAAMPGSKTLKRFNETFPNAQNVKWIDDKAGFFVSFMQNGNFNKVFYNSDGNLVYALKYCNAEELPNNIVMGLNEKYGAAKVLGVTEVTTQSSMFYNVKLSKEKKLYDLNVLADGSIAKAEVYDDGTGTVAGQ
jgi:hypothetical protein